MFFAGICNAYFAQGLLKISVIGNDCLFFHLFSIYLCPNDIEFL